MTLNCYIPQDSFPNADFVKGLEMYRRLTLLLLMSWIAIQLAFIVSPSEEPVWSTLATHCDNGRACWLGISAAGISADQAEQFLLKHSDELVVSQSLGQNIQWTHPEGYQGMMLFNRSSVSFIELYFPSRLVDNERIRLGEVILTFGPPDDIERRLSGETALFYYNRLLIVRVDTVRQSHLSPHHSVNAITIPSPYGGWMENPGQSGQRQKWHGFSTLPQ
jgi:hypothetical protein